jgi:serine/threonine protein kinase
MAGPATSEDLLDIVLKSGVVEPDVLHAFEEHLRGHNAWTDDPERLAGLLERQGLVTRFQNSHFLNGRWRGLIIGPYKVLDLIGSGGVGFVYRGEHLRLRRPVAIKVLSWERLGNEVFIERFQRESRATAALDHPNIVRAYDFGRAGALHYLVMEYVEGESLLKLVEQEGLLPAARAADYVRQAAQGLQHAHEARLVHRDVKPSNLILTPKGVIKILDMGLVRVLADDAAPGEAITQAGTVLGTPDYMAPEQAQDSRQIDIRSDLYSLGCVFYFLLAGRPPFAGGTTMQKLFKHSYEEPVPIRALRPDVSPGVAAVVRRLMAKQPEDRYQTPAELVQALEAIAPPAPEPLSAPTKGVPTPPAPTARDRKNLQALAPKKSAAPRRPVLLAGAAVLLLFLAGTGSFLAKSWLTNGPKPPSPDGGNGTNGSTPAPPAAADRLYVAQAPLPDTPGCVYRSIPEALEKAKDGDTVAVLDAVVEDVLHLQGTSWPNKAVTLEGATPSGQRVVWRAPAGHPDGKPLWKLTAVAGLRLKGFHLDGRDRLARLVVLEGTCPGLTLEDVTLTGFAGSGLTLSDCQGEDVRPVSLDRLRTVGGPSAAAGLSFEAGPGQVNGHVRVRDGRFEGPCPALVRVDGSLGPVAFHRNRFHQAHDAFLFRQASAKQRLHLALVSNTFADLRHGLHWDGPPLSDPAPLVVAQRNLFTRTQRLCATDRFAPTLQGPALWIWADEGSPAQAAPAGSRYFRRVFDVPDPPPQTAGLHVCADDAFTVWLNGEQVGGSRFSFFTRRGHTFNIGRRLRPGRNVLAVQGDNHADLNTGRETPAGLLAYLSTPAKAFPPVPSDSRWRASAKAPAGWQDLNFNDTDWPAARELAAHSAAGPLWGSVVWEGSAPNPPSAGRAPSFQVSALGNVADRHSLEGYPGLEARVVDFELPADPADDATFLRYPSASPLARSGPDGGPAGLAPTPVAPRPAAVLLVTAAGQQTPFPTARAALLAAREGDRVVVEGELLEEHLELHGKEVGWKRLVLEGKSSGSGQPLWRLPPAPAAGRPLLRLADVPGLTVRGFSLDGKDQTRDLVALSGRCPGLVLDQLQLTGFLTSAVRLENCEGDEGRPVLLHRLRAVPGQGSEAALWLTADAHRATRHCQVVNSRFEGPYQSIVAVAGAADKVEFQGNRFFQAADGLRYHKGESPARLGVAFDSNTFHDLQTLLHLEAPPPPDGRPVTFQNNLVTRVRRLAQLDGVKTERATTADWVWYNEGTPEGYVPAATRYFRKEFELPRPAARAVLDLVCDDAFTVWLNGAPVGEGELRFNTRRVTAFEVAKHLKAGRNVLAVQGVNRTNPDGSATHAGLLAQLTCWEGGGAEPRAVVVTDKAWRASPEGPAGWQQPDFDDRGWAAVRVFGSYAKMDRSGPPVIWDSVVEEECQGMTRPLVAAPVDNYRDLASRDGFPPLRSLGLANFVPLGTDPSNDAEFLRYPRTSPLFRAGPRKPPVGVPAGR